MKKNTKHCRHLRVHRYQPQPAYPNAADSCFFTNRALDLLTVIVSGVGFTCAMLFWAALA